MIERAEMRVVAGRIVLLLGVLGALVGNAWAQGAEVPPDALGACIQAVEQDVLQSAPPVAPGRGGRWDGQALRPSREEMAARVARCVAERRAEASRAARSEQPAAAPVIISALPTSERDALIALYTSTNGAAWTTRTNWRNASDTGFNDPGTECTWYGVTCDVAGTHVTGVTLAGNQLVGPVPSSIADLTALEILKLSSNALTGAIPVEMANATALQARYLGFNSLSGSPPAALGSLTSLMYLHCSYNQLTGSIPPELGSLTIQELLSHNGVAATIIHTQVMNRGGRCVRSQMDQI